MTVDGWDAATGTRAAALVVTNDDASSACQLQGLPNLRIMQSGQDLEINVNEYEPSNNEEYSYSIIMMSPDQ